MLAARHIDDPQATSSTADLILGISAGCLARSAEPKGTPKKYKTLTCNKKADEFGVIFAEPVVDDALPNSQPYSLHGCSQTFSIASNRLTRIFISFAALLSSGLNALRDGAAAPTLYQKCRGTVMIILLCSESSPKHSGR
jgi:hypothetical protein